MQTPFQLVVRLLPVPVTTPHGLPMKKILPSIEVLEARIAPAFAAVFDLANLNGANGFSIPGAAAGDSTGWRVSDAGDVNGDDYDDLVISSSIAARAYVIFGRESGFDPSFDLNSLDGSNGFVLIGTGARVASAGDINGDGFDDLILGRADSSRGYVVFGKDSGFAATLSLSSLNGTDGFQILATAGGAFRELGSSVSGAGDVNGDGFDDIIIGDRLDPGAGGGNFPGAAFVIFGKSSGFDPTFDVASLNGVNGFKISGQGERRYVGLTADGAGDVNGDGFDDVIVGGSRDFAAYVVFGKASGFAADLDLSTLDGVNGTTIRGNGNLGVRPVVSGAGDVNGDGVDDFIVHTGSKFSPSPGPVTSYVIFGSRSGFGVLIDPVALTSARGFSIETQVTEQYGFHFVSGGGDINGDGFDDVLVGFARGDSPAENSGVSYVIFGKAESFGGNFDVTTLNGSNGFRVDGLAAGDSLGVSIRNAGDINGDGFDDVIIGAYGADATGQNSGAGYVIFGGAGLRISDASVSEANSGTVDMTFSVSLPRATSEIVSVKYSTQNGTAQAGSDFTAIESALLTFAPGETEKTITVQVSGDTLFELDEAFTIVLSEPTNSSIVRGSGSGVILNDDAPPIVSIAPASVVEGDGGIINTAFTVSLSAVSGAPVTVQYGTANGTALAGSDFTAVLPQTVTFAPGETTKIVLVDVLGDKDVESDETFTVNLSQPQGATIGSGTAIGTILNDDTALNISDFSALEGDAATTTFEFTVTLENASALPVT